MHETILKLRVLAHAEIMLARIYAKRAANHATLYAICIGLVLMAVAMVNVGAYQLLAETYSNASAAFIVAAANGLLAVIVLLAVRLLKPGPEEQTVREIRDTALAEFSADFDEIEADISLLGADVKRLRKGFSVLRSGSRFGINLVSLAPLMSTIIESVKKRRKERKGESPTT